MWEKLGLSAVVVASTMFADAPSPGTVSIGLTSAQAKDYYTRKRVNGRWVVGKFARKPALKDSAGVDHPIPPVRPGAIKAALIVAANSEIDTTATAIAATPETYLGRLRGALEVRADDLRWSLLTAPKKPSGKESSEPPTPDKIVIDLKEGIKTTFYSDGSVREEPIEPTQTGSADPSR
jgi:hypothetical protein